MGTKGAETSTMPLNEAIRSRRGASDLFFFCLRIAQVFFVVSKTLYSRGMKDLFTTIGKYIVWGYNKTHWFTNKEAWWIYRLGAFLEAIGWTLLISAIIYRRFDLPEYESFISVAGRLHGIFFVAYFAAVIATARSMGWGLWRIGLALAAGVPPFTSLVFEQIMSWHRKKHPVHIAPPKDLDK
jgi:integral membrane protein